MRILLTGASGFLGGRIAELLLLKGHELILYTRRLVPELSERCQQFIGEFSDETMLGKALQGAEAVIHCAGKTGLSGNFKEYYSSNTLLTTKLLDASKESASIRHFVYTSTPSVVHQGESLLNVNESAPYMDNKNYGYSYTKMLAEKTVLEANRKDFKTLALRPHLIWGPKDPHFLPVLFQKAKDGKLFYFSGGPYQVSHTFIDNAAYAHILALEKLEEGAPVDGLAYFIAEPEPMDLLTLINTLLGTAGLPPVTRVFNKHLGLLLAVLIEFIWKITRRKGQPPLSPFLVRQMSTSHYFDLSRAKTLLSYSPPVKTEDAFIALRKYLREKPI
ncbi:MAG: NAD-dependent epimerase/dehydratase family protein [Deltaproteobacteria bacterium]|jgi:nucleoside-diphosphate-sugar epimerase|nr:NAD-dependent epimerase/dehydratase family protein [Deltaproteobacteria bacterium]